MNDTSSLPSDPWFGDSFGACRRIFLDSAARAGVPVHHYPHPAEAAASVDAAYVGDTEPDMLLIVTSGAHGVELPFGSAVQSAWLGTPSNVPDKMGVLMVHAVNSVGAATRRRFTEENVDLCRNFAHEPSDNPGYREIEAWLNVNPADEAACAQADAQLDRYQRERGADFIAAVMGGQFVDPLGFGFGGHTPTWARGTLEAAIQSFVATRRPTQVAILDLHTGVGAWASPTFVSLQQGDAAARAHDWLPALLAPAAEASGQRLHPATGHPTEGYERMFPLAEVTSLVLEMGTYPPADTLPVLIQEHRYTRWGLADTPQGQAVRTTLWEQHAPVDEAWRTNALDAGTNAITHLVSCLRAAPG